MIKKTRELAKKEEKHYDLTMPFGPEEPGLTIHLNRAQPQIAFRWLAAHCMLRKYKEKVDRWFGMRIDPLNGSLNLLYYLNNEWRFDAELERLSKNYQGKVNSLADISSFLSTKLKNIKKTGRNDPCPCGSGKKYKKCCIDKKTTC